MRTGTQISDLLSMDIPITETACRGAQKYAEVHCIVLTFTNKQQREYKLSRSW
jgi:hypothetical protein